MKRNQLDLQAEAVSVLEEFERVSRTSLSKLIRDSVDQLSNNLGVLLSTHSIRPQSESVLSRLIGLVPSGTAGSTDYARRSDREYLKD